MSSTPRGAPDEPEVEAALAEYLSLAARGAQVDTERFCEERGALAARLRERLSELAPLLARLQALGRPSAVSQSPGSREPDGAALIARLESLVARTRDARHYREGARLGGGGMGEVFELFDADLHRAVAKKVMRGGAFVEGAEGAVPDFESIGRFLDEAQITAQLDHPGVVPVHDVGFDEHGRLFFTMREVRGQTLADVLARVRAGDPDWPQARVLACILRVCETLAYAHQKGVIHRDLKPSNVMVGELGETYVLDWGLARVLPRDGEPTSALTSRPVLTDRGAAPATGPESALHTRSGDLVGTPAYMPPEQLDGDIARLDERSDVYAVGALLYELLAGRPPHVWSSPAPTREELRRELAAGAPPLARRGQALPAELVAICEKATARSPAQRYRDMRDLALDLRAYLEERVVRAHRTGPVAELTKWVQRNRRFALGLLAAVVLGSVAAIAWWRDFGRERRTLWRTYVTHIWEADRLLESSEADAARARLAGSPPALRGWEWRHLAQRADGSTRAVATPALGERPSWVRALVVARDGAVLWAAENGGVFRGTLDAEPERFGLVHPAAVAALALDAAGERLVTGGEDARVRLLDARSGELSLDLPRAGTLAGPVTAVASAPDGSVLAADSAGRLTLFDGQSGAEVARLETGAPVFGALLDARGERVVFQARDGTLRVWSPVGGVVERLCDRRGPALGALALEPGGARVAAGIGTSVWLVPLDGAAPLELQNGALVTAVAFDPSGRLLATGAVDRSVGVFDVPSGVEHARWHGHDDAVTALAFRGVGELVSGGHDGSVRTWSLDASSATRALARLGAAPLGLAVDHAGAAWALVPDGAALLALGGTGAGERVALRSAAAAALALDAGADGLVVAAQDGRVLVVDPHTGAERRELARLDAPATCVASVPGGALAAAGTRHGVVLLLTAGAPPIELAPASGARVHALRFSSDGALLAAAAAERVVIWSVAERAERGALVRGATSADARALAFSSDGRRLLTGWGDHVVLVTDAASGARELELSGAEGSVAGEVAGVTFLDGDRRIASGSGDGRVRLWDAERGDLLLVLRGQAAAIVALAALPDGGLLGAARDGLVRLWRAPAR